MVTRLIFFCSALAAHIARPILHRASEFSWPAFSRQPGTSWAYSNAGFLGLGVIIEKVSGENYYDYLRRHIFEPAGMSQTDSYWKTDGVPNLGVGYTRAPDADKNQPRTRNNEFLRLRGTSAGGGYSTVGDLAKFASALLSHKLLNEEMTRMVTTGKVAAPRGSKYAYGFDDRLQNGNRIICHNGGSPGANAVRYLRAVRLRGCCFI
jgi:D-alanyl-D-alanine carboxypeptidase